MCVHTDHLGTFDNHNSRSKFHSHSSTLMKNPIRWGGGGGVSHFPGSNVFRGSLCLRADFFSGILGHHFQRMINNMYPIK